MTELAFPLLGTALVVLVALPASALLACGLLALLDRWDAGALHGLGARYAVLVGSSLLPIAWLLSAGLHQAETGRFVLACLLEHHAAELCVEPLLFVLALSSVLGGCAFKAARGAARSGAPAAASPSELTARLARIAAELAPRELARRVAVTEQPGFAIGAVGLARPQIRVEAAFAAQLSDAELRGALAHELEHVRARDPLRYFALTLALALNPLGRRWLEPHARRWLAAREAHCDREAVIGGADPLALAGALVRAARPAALAPSLAAARWLAGLGAGGAGILRLRVELLFAFVERPPARCCRREPSAMPAVVALLVLAVILPHHVDEAGTAALDFLHVSSEQLLRALLR